MNKSLKAHYDAIKSGQVTKTNVIGIRKALNAAEMRYLRHQPDANLDADAFGLVDSLIEHRPRVVGELHDTGVVVLQNPRYAKRWADWQAKSIAAIDHFKLVGYRPAGYVYHPIYAVWAKVPPCVGPDPFPEGATYEAFTFINIPWQSGGNGPEIIA
jgi:hypothetical protein